MSDPIEWVDLTVEKAIYLRGPRHAAGWEELGREPPAPCTLVVGMRVEDRNIAPAYTVRCRTLQALRYAQREIVRTLQSLDGLILTEEQRVDDPTTKT